MLYKLAGVALALNFATFNASGEDVADLVRELKSPEAKRAILAYESTLSISQDDFRERVTLARKKLLAELEAAQTSATKANLLDEAVRIRDIKRAYRPDEIPAAPMTEIHIVAAFYGQNISWLDVTDKVRTAVKGRASWSTKVATEDWGEPAPGFGGPRTLMIRFSVGGKVNFRAAYQGRVISIP